MIEKVIDGDIVITKIVELKFSDTGMTPPRMIYRVKQKNGLLLTQYSVTRLPNFDCMSCHIQLGGGVPITYSDFVDEDLVSFMQGGFAERHIHIFGSSEDAAHYQESTLKRMLGQNFWMSSVESLGGVGPGIENLNEFILPNLTSNRSVFCVHPERLPADVQPDDLRKFCEMEQARFPEEWGPRFARAIFKTSNDLARWLELSRRGYKEQLSDHELYKRLISNPDPDKTALEEFHYPVTIALGEFYDVVLRLTEKYFAGEYGAKDIPGLIIVSLWNSCINYMQREERRRQDEPLTIAVSLDEEQENEDGSKDKMVPEPEGGVSCVMEVEEATDSRVPMLLFIAKNLDLPATEIHKQLEAKGYDIGYKTVQRRKREIEEIFKEFYAVELEFQDDIERSKKKHPKLMKHEFPTGYPRIAERKFSQDFRRPMEDISRRDRADIKKLVKENVLCAEQE